MDQNGADGTFESDDYIGFSFIANEPLGRFSAGYWEFAISGGGNGGGTTERIYIRGEAVAPTVSLSASPTTVTEAGTATVTATISAAQDVATTVTLDYATLGGTATAGSGYTPVTTITIPANQTTGTAEIVTAADGIDENDETVSIFLASVSGGNGATSDGEQAAYFTIADNDPEPTVSVNDITVNEGDGNVMIPVTLSAESGKTITVNVWVGGEDDTAEFLFDYGVTALPIALEFAPGETEKTFRISIFEDNGPEPPETIWLGLADAVNAQFGNQFATATIIDNDDSDAPEVQGEITLQGSPPSNAEELLFGVTFNEEARNVSADDFELVTTGTAAGTIAAISADAGTEFTVTVNGISGSGTLQLNLKAGTDIEDQFGNSGPQPFSGPPFTVDHDGPTVTITGAPECLTGTQAFEVKIAFSEDVADFIADDITITNGAVTAFAGSGRSYGATITPSGGDVTIAVAAGVATDAAGNPNAAAEPVTVQDDLVERTREQIADFIVRRGHGIVAGQPDLDGFLTGNPAPGGGPLGSLSAEVNPLGYDFSFFTSRSTVERGLEAPLANGYAPFADTPVSGGAPRFDAWVRLSGSGSFTDSSDASLWLGHVGVHYRMNDDLLLGVMGQFDYASQAEDDGPGSTDGWGWMVGPYVVARAPGQSLTFDGRVLVGQSHNQISPLGTFEDDFDTTRWLARGRVSGDYKWGTLTVTPAASLTYFQETQHTYIDSLSNMIDGQTISLGEFAFGPTFSYDHLLEDGTLVRPSFGIDGVWTFAEDDGAATTLGPGFDGDTLRARVEAGLAVTAATGWSVKADAFYDGIGASNAHAWGGSLGIVIPFN